MTDAFDRFVRLQKRLNKINQEAERLEGAMQEQIEHAFEEFDCESIEELEQKLKQLQREEVEAEKQFNESLSKFEEKWSDRLG